MIRFEQLEQLHWLWAIPVVVAVFLLGRRLWYRRAMRIATSNLVERLTTQVSGHRAAWKLVLIVLTLVSLVAAMIDPRWGVTYEEVRQRGVDVVVVLDVSRSMLAEDASPNRLDRARQFVLELVDELRGDRIGLVACAGTASVRCPLTADYGSFRLALEEVTPLTAARGGSLLGDGIRVALDSFTDDLPDSKAIILLSDGEDHGSYPVEAARVAFEEHGVRIFTIGLGDARDGARIPMDRGVFLTHEGREVWSKLEEDNLREMALAGEGAYVPAGTRSVDIGAFFDQHVARLTKREIDATVIRRYHAQYQWFAGLALALLLVDTLLGTRRTGVRSR